MRGTVAICLWLILAAGGGALAQDRGSAAPDPVVVELFTSQGCSSCPPADAFLAELRKDSAVLPLALHVDYWDYLGWQDSFAMPGATDRQRAYAAQAGAMMVYTPQIIVDGHAIVAGHRPAQVLAAIMKARSKSSAVRIAVMGEAPRLRVRLTAVAPLEAPAEVILVRFMDEAEVAVSRGENAGHTLLYSSVVTEWTRIGAWDGRAPMEAETPLAPPLSSAILVQAPGPGPILAAARLD